MTDVTIRKIQKKDLFNGFLQSLDALRKTSDLNPKKAEKIFNKISENPNQAIYVAIKDSKVIGATTIIIEQKFIHGGSKVGHIEDVVVAKEFQGKGIGQKIVKSMLKYAQDQGCYKTILDCTDELIPFYESIGFKKHSNSMRFDHLSKK